MGRSCSLSRWKRWSRRKKASRSSRSNRSNRRDRSRDKIRGNNLVRKNYFSIQYEYLKGFMTYRSRMWNLRSRYKKSRRRERSSRSRGHRRGRRRDKSRGYNLIVRETYSVLAEILKVLIDIQNWGV